MLISRRIILPQNPDLHREQRHQPTKKVLRDTEETKGDFRLPRFSKQVRTLESKQGTLCFEKSSSYSKKSSLCSRILFLFSHPPTPKHDRVANHDGYNGRNRLRRFRTALNEENLELVTVSKTDKRINGIVTTETNEKT